MLKKILNLLDKMTFPDDIKCIVCDDELSIKNRFSICPKCTLKPLTLFCDVCGRAIDDVESNTKSNYKNNKTYQFKSGMVCRQCEKNPPHFDIARAAFFYDEEIKHLIYKLKFGNAVYLAKFLSEYMLDVLTNFIEMDESLAPEYIAFVPMYHKKQNMRGYNQAQLLAKELSKKSGIPIIDVLERQKDTKNVARMTRAERKTAIEGSIIAKDYSEIKYKNILLIDDVFTTGTTANECAKKLKKVYVDNVYVLTFATSHT